MKFNCRAGIIFRRPFIATTVCVVIALQATLLFMVHYLLQENAELRHAGQSYPAFSGSERGCQCPFSKLRPESLSNTKRKPHHFLPSNLTIILFNPTGSNATYIDSQITKVKKLFPSVAVFRSDSDKDIGKSMNQALAQIKTEYFLMLESHVSLSTRPEESIELLWKALETYPELDFVGGSYLTSNNRKLHLTCSRFRVCKWTYSESYEYARSLGDVMVCEGTSSSFMGRTGSFKKKTRGFDETLPGRWVVKDFFLRAKANNVVVGTRPGVMFLVDKFETLYEAWNSRNIANEIVPFSVKHKVFIYKDIDGNTVELCNPTSPLSGEGLCIEKNSLKLMLGDRHWAYHGLHGLPFVIRYLEVAISVGKEYLEKHNVVYALQGGVSLGALKTRAILPWEAGDVDFDVWGHDMDSLYKFLKPLADERGYVLVKVPSLNAVNMFCTSKKVGDRSGGLLSLFVMKGKAPAKQDFVKCKVGNIWLDCRRNFVGYLTGEYGGNYLQHTLYNKKENINCKIEGHNACLPDFRRLFGGTGGNQRDFYCDV